MANAREQADRKNAVLNQQVAPHTRDSEATLSELLFLYLWPTAIFEDVSTGTREEQCAKYRRNREKRIFLPYHAKVWLFFSLIFLMSGVAVPDSFPPAVAAKIAAIAILTAFTCSLSVVIVVAVAYIWFACNE